ncbi:hypothetical protein NFJ02_01g40480 [Pycnococcus provasolii]
MPFHARNAATNRRTSSSFPFARLSEAAVATPCGVPPTLGTMALTTSQRGDLYRLARFGSEPEREEASRLLLEDATAHLARLRSTATDSTVGYKDEARYNNFLDALKSKFKIGSAKIGIDRIFNIKVEHRRQMIRLSQQKYIQDLITQYNVVEDPKVTAPMSTS